MRIEGAAQALRLNFQRSRWASPGADKSFVSAKAPNVRASSAHHRYRYNSQRFSSPELTLISCYMMTGTGDFRNRSGRNDNSHGGGSLGRAPRPRPIGLNAVTPFYRSWPVSPLFHEDGQILLFPAPINHFGVIGWPKQRFREEKALTEITRAEVLSVHIRVPPIFPHRQGYPHR
jgi:hypothetical protein